MFGGGERLDQVLVLPQSSRGESPIEGGEVVYPLRGEYESMAPDALATLREELARRAQRLPDDAPDHGESGDAVAMNAGHVGQNAQLHLRSTHP